MTERDREYLRQAQDILVRRGKEYDLNGMSDTYWEIDQEFRILEANRRAEKLAQHGT